MIDTLEIRLTHRFVQLSPALQTRMRSALQRSALLQRHFVRWAKLVRTGFPYVKMMKLQPDAGSGGLVVGARQVPLARILNL